MKVKRAVMWFTDDLRISDNETFLEAVNGCEEIIPFYCLDSTLFDETRFGFKKCGNRRLNFILESLLDLQNTLHDKGSELYFTFGDPVIELSKIVSRYGAQRVYTKKQIASEEKQLQLNAEKEIWKFKCTLETYSTSTLYLASDLPFSIKDIPQLFTEFRKKVEKDSFIRPVCRTPEKINSPSFDIDTPAEIKKHFMDYAVHDKNSAYPFRGGESEALKRMNQYFFETKAVLTYKETRNGLVGLNYSSKFSAYLSQGCISPKTIYHTLKKLEEQEGANDSTYWLGFELLWRDFFRFNMKKFGRLYFLKGGIQGKKDRCGSFDSEKLNRWVKGETGIEFVDANMRELSQTGFMSNRGRQITASYLVNDLKCDWRYGAAYFEEQLIDYDVSSNWGNWAYIAGVGNDNRSDRYFNIEKQKSTYDPKGEYCKLWMEKLN